MVQPGAGDTRAARTDRSSLDWFPDLKPLPKGKATLSYGLT